MKDIRINPNEEPQAVFRCCMDCSNTCAIQSPPTRTCSARVHTLNAQDNNLYAQCNHFQPFHDGARTRWKEILVFTDRAISVSNPSGLSVKIDDLSRMRFVKEKRNAAV